MSRSEAAGERRIRGYRALLNLQEQPHWTVFLSDFELPAADIKKLKRELERVPTQLIFLTIEDGIDLIMEKLVTTGVDPARDYISIQGLVLQQQNVSLLDEIYATIPRRDMTRVELPLPECGFRPAFASQLLKVISEADYSEQEWISNRFFRRLAEHTPYRVTVDTRDGRLQITDDWPWFENAGPLEESETRIIPGGEVAYAGNAINGTFVIDGAILPLPEHPDAADDALQIQWLSGELHRYPLRAEIRDGYVVDLVGAGRPQAAISELLDRNPRYRRVTEVGISFNRACHTFIYDWPAASNEARPGVHIGLGGTITPDDHDRQLEPLVHIDCIAANCQVLVNGHPFLRASS